MQEAGASILHTPMPPPQLHALMEARQLAGCIKSSIDIARQPSDAIRARAIKRWLALDQID